MLKKLWTYARPYRGWIFAGVLCSAAEAVFELLISWTWASPPVTGTISCARAF